MGKESLEGSMNKELKVRQASHSQVPLSKVSHSKLGDQVWAIARYTQSRLTGPMKTPQQIIPINLRFRLLFWLAG